MKWFFSTLPRNIIGCFRGRMLLWQLLAIGLTFICVVSGFDWSYFTATRSPLLWRCMIPSAPIGFFVPMLLPVTLVLVGAVMGRARYSVRADGGQGTARPTLTHVGWAIGQAELMGSLISSTYKAFTGRIHPAHTAGGDDISHLFRFGFLRGGTFWGWPSSHTTVAFAMAVTVFTLFPKQRWLGWLAIAYALYIGLGVSVTIHWFSDFAAGAVIGSAIGVVVGRSFSNVAP